MINFIKSFIRKILPKPIKNWASNIYFKFLSKHVQLNHHKALKKIHGKEKIKVVFLLIHESVWKYAGLYNLMLKDKRFEPIVVVCPYTPYGKEVMLRDMNQAYNSFKEKGYNVVKSLNEETGAWLNVKKELKPDLVFFTNPWKLTKNKYSITNFNDTLTCYVPYFFQVTKHLGENFGGLVQNLSWKVFYESNVHFDFAKEYSRNSAINVVVSGYPALDSFLFDQKAKSDPWKIKDNKLKRVIWAPHHTIPGQDSGLRFSNFLLYSDLFLELITNKSLEVQIAFKPHPLLRPKLSKDDVWGKEKTDSYYRLWETSERGMLAEGDYVDLFLTSDAIIHDSGSFTIEYLATKKPSLYLLNSIEQLEGLNCFGKSAVQCHYIARNYQEVEGFLKDVVILENDSKKDQRISFIKGNLIPPNKKSATQNIFDYLKSNLL